MQSFKSVERNELGLSLSGITRWHQYGMSPYRSLTANTLVSSSFRFSDTFHFTQEVMVCSHFDNCLFVPGLK